MYPLELENKEPITSDQGVVMADVEFEVGRTGTTFFTALMEGRILATRCVECQINYVPPRNTCQRCFALLDEWVEVGPEGELLTWTVVRGHVPLAPAEPPYAIGVVKLDGADTGLVHLVAGCEAAELKSGMRLEAVFARDRKGNIGDIAHFAPAPRA